MRRQIREAKYVLVVCSEAYYRRAEGQEEPGRGLGAVWEAGLVTIEAYNGQGRNEKFIPVVFSADDIRYIPDFLQATTRYDLSSSGDYERLYARLTGQRTIERPPLGQIRPVGARQVDEEVSGESTRPLPATSSAVSTVRQTPLVLIQTASERMFMRAERVQESNDELLLEIVPASGQETAFIAGLGQGRGSTKFAVAFGSTAFQAMVKSVTRTHVSGGDRFTVLARPTENDRGYSMEMGTSSHSADQIAELRARRILLDEKPPAELERWGNVDTMLEALVAGLQVSLVVKSSPLPDLYRQLRNDRSLFLEAARLLAVLALHLSNTVEHVLRLDLSFEGTDAVKVSFEGRRRKEYSNRPAYEIHVEGICRLS
jgi:hypothetical protein